jgi:hypothetical protein
MQRLFITALACLMNVCVYGQSDYQITLDNICTGSMENGFSAELEIYHPSMQLSIESILVDWGVGDANNYYPEGNPIYFIESPLYFEYGTYDIQIYITELNGSVISFSETLFIENNPSIGVGINGNTSGVCVPIELSFPIFNFSNNAPSTIYEFNFGDGSINQVFSHIEMLDMSSPVITHLYEIISCGYTTPNGSQDAFMFMAQALNSCGTVSGSIDPIVIYDCETNEGGCEDYTYGCTDETACNYDVLAIEDNGTCDELDECGVCGGTGVLMGDCDCNGNQVDAIGVCGGDCEDDYDGDGVCDIDETYGCTYPTSTNYNPSATNDNGSCEFEQNSDDCVGDLDGNGNVTSSDLLLFLVAFGSDCE